MIFVDMESLKKYPNYEDYEIKNFVDDLHDLLNYLQI